jgi:hypothetical protein
MALNLTGIALAIANIWRYPRKYTTSFVLGNLLVAILMRNELFGRLLYLLVNTLFAKVSMTQDPLYILNYIDTVDSSLIPIGMHFSSPTSRRYSFWVRDIWIPLVDFRSCHNSHPSQK